MSISVIKTAFVYLAISGVAIVIEKVYGIFGHGVTSPAMTWMFLYPLLGGAAMYLSMGYAIPKIFQNPGYRISFNLYNSGIATITTGSFLYGIFEIAGTSSWFTFVFFALGGLLILAAILFFLSQSSHHNSIH